MKIPEDKLPDKLTDREVKRLNYFNTQFLQEADFQDEQAYHISLRRFHNRSIHGFGIIEGLEITRAGDKEIAVAPGVAIDKLGREVVLSPMSVVKSYDLSKFKANDLVFLTIAYDNDTDEKDRNPSGDTTKFIRITERPKLEATTTKPSDDGTVIVLGQVTLDGSSNVTPAKIDLSGRRMVRSKTSPIVGTAKDGEIVLAPDGKPPNWVIFVSPRQLNVKKTGPFIAEFSITVSATEVATGWAISCFSQETADLAARSKSPGEVNYMIVRK
jgi:hypothetical protein